MISPSTGMSSSLLGVDRGSLAPRAYRTSLDLVDRRLADRPYLAATYSIGDTVCHSSVVPVGYGLRLHLSTRCAPIQESVRVHAKLPAARSYGASVVVIVDVSTADVKSHNQKPSP